ncbi:hypothetical protein [Rubritalea tangerina]|uniref:hypothetical protein n=1 Tax=Rubritalea tangerina TaxID=430798 RepID=UPI0036085434
MTALVLLDSCGSSYGLKIIVLILVGRKCLLLVSSSSCGLIAQAKLPFAIIFMN